MKKLVALVMLAMIATSCASSADSSETDTTSSIAPSETTSTSPTTTTVPSTPTLVFTVREDGGCMMAGPNCAEYQFYDDGRVEVYRVGTEITTPEATGTIDQEFIVSVQDELVGIDLALLADSLAPGECRGCYDGIDTTFVYNVPGTFTTFASTEVDLDDAIPLFAATWSALDEAQLTLGQLEPEMRTG